MAQTGEFDSAVPYWLAALDVFETGETLPCRAMPSNELQEDWRMAIMWGRSLVSLAEEIISKGDEAKSGFLGGEPNWPPNSIFTTIISSRPPTTRRMHLSNASANDLLVLAMDQFSHGIFHMPRALHQFQAHQSVHMNFATAFPPLIGESFSRASELFTIASDVLGVAEQLDDVAERRCWASWSDSVFSQMEMEANIDSWREPITRARGRCWLIAGTAGIEEIEDALEAGQCSVLSDEEAQEARESLSKGTTTISSNR